MISCDFKPIYSTLAAHSAKSTKSITLGNNDFLLRLLHLNWRFQEMRFRCPWLTHDALAQNYLGLVVLRVFVLRVLISLTSVQSTGQLHKPLSGSSKTGIRLSKVTLLPSLALSGLDSGKPNLFSFSFSLVFKWGLHSGKIIF